MDNNYSTSNNMNKRPLGGSAPGKAPVRRQPLVPSQRPQGPTRSRLDVSAQRLAQPQATTPGQGINRSQAQTANYQLEGDRLSQSLEEINQSPTDSNSRPSGDSGKRSLTTSLTCGLLGLILGGAAVFAVMQVLQQPPECPECDCSQSSGSDTPAITLGALDYDFLKLEQSSDNIIYSPLSIKNGLALLNTGASGETKAEISEVLGDATLPKYENIPDQLSLANGVFIRQSFEDKVLPEYVSAVTNDYSTEVIYDDFADSTNMDNWVSQKTFGLINSIGIQPTPDTQMVLANALAIQLGWTHTFDSNNTQSDVFYSDAGGESSVDTMHQTTNADDILYHQDDNLTVLSMPLEPISGANLEFVAVMPTNDLGAYIESLDTSALDATLNTLTPASEAADGIAISIPKFSFDYALDFKNDLEQLGISSAFSQGVADFSGMASEPLYVSDAIHKANIDFSEEGIKAAAVTAFAMLDQAIAAEDTQPIPITINRPFLFLIRDKSNGAIWFTGAVHQPTSEATTETSAEPPMDN